MITSRTVEPRQPSGAVKEMTRRRRERGMVVMVVVIVMSEGDAAKMKG